MLDHLSHSQIETWQQCPRRWQLTKLDQVPQAPSEHLIFGDAIHQALEADGRSWIEHRIHLPFGRLVALFSDALDRCLAAVDPRCLLAGKTPDLRLKGLATLRAYSEQIAPVYHPVAVEEEFDIALLLDGGYTLHYAGRIDARTQPETSAPVIVDFKTASKPWPGGIEHSKPQAAAYLMADRTNERFPSATRVTFVVLATLGVGERYECAPEFRTTTRSDALLDAYTQTIRRTADEIQIAAERKFFEARTGPLCGWCGVLGSCEAGKQWLLEQGRTPAVPVISREGVVIA